MGFWSKFFSDLQDGFNNGYETQKVQEEKKTEQIKRFREREQSAKEKLNFLQFKSDSYLLNQYNSYSVSKEEKIYIEKILESRGYIKNDNGSYNKK